MLTTTKRDELIEWAKKKGLFSSVDINTYKQTAYHLRADRDVRQLVTEGVIRRLSKEEIALRGLHKSGCQHIGWWQA